MSLSNSVLEGVVLSGFFLCAGRGWYLIKLAENLLIKEMILSCWFSQLSALIVAIFKILDMTSHQLEVDQQEYLSYVSTSFVPSHHIPCLCFALVMSPFSFTFPVWKSRLVHNPYQEFQF